VFPTATDEFEQMENDEAYTPNARQALPTTGYS